MIYIASKIHNALRWIKLKERAIPISSSWIYNGDLKSNPNTNWGQYWKKYIDDIRISETLIVFTELGYSYKGVLCEVSAALALRIPVIQVGKDVSDIYEILKHPDIDHASDLHHAFNVACSNVGGNELYKYCDSLPEELFI